MRPVLYICWDLQQVKAYDFHQTDCYDHIYIGMIHHVMTLIEGILQCHGKTAVFKEIWAGIPPYTDFYRYGKAPWQISLWSGKEIRSFSWILHPALAAALHDPQSRHRAVFQRVLISLRSLVCWSHVAWDYTYATESLSYVANYFVWIDATMDVFTNYRTSMATDSIAHACMMVIKLHLKAEHPIEDNEIADLRNAVSCVHRSHQKADDVPRVQRVYNSTALERSSVDFVKIHLMLHYEESVQRIGNIIEDCTKTQDMNNPMMCMGLYCWSNRNFRYERQIFNNCSLIHVIWMHFLNLLAAAKQIHRTPNIQEAH